MHRQADKVPTDLFLWGAGASIATALVLKATKRDHGALFVGQWVAPFLLLGILNRMAKGDKNCRTE